MDFELNSVSGREFFLVNSAINDTAQLNLHHLINFKLHISSRYESGD
jgi:hypothetical protein